MKLSVLAMVALFSGSVFASKARVNSLQGANHLVDTQTVFTVPSHMMLLNPYMTFEFGAAGTDAEGGIMRSFSNGHRLLAYVGHQNTTDSAAAPDLRTSASYLGQNNPIEVLYGMGNMAFGASVSMVDNKRTKTKEQTVVAKWGMNFDDNWVYAHLHLISMAEKDNAGDTDEATAAPYLTVGTSFAMNDLRIFGEIDYGSGKDDPGSAVGTTTDVDDMNVSVGLEDRSLRKDAADIYYGIRLDWAKREYEDAEMSATKLPAFLGIEYGMVSWATVRASVSQNILFGNTKDETGTPSVTEKEGINSDTLVAAGLGLKWNNLMLDGSLTAAGNGDINGSQFISQASLTYNF
ncbi:MAG TPA: hypothetical protein PKC28_09635 [Bdellovibrionales bacterium]|nr:hypothetical protein [Bdellovibrionales bacterium]